MNILCADSIFLWPHKMLKLNLQMSSSDYRQCCSPQQKEEIRRTDLPHPSIVDDEAVGGSFVVPLRRLAVVNVILLAISYLLLTGACVVARVDFDPDWEVITTWKVLYLRDVRSNPFSTSKPIDYLDVGDTCEVYGNVYGVPNDDDIRSQYGGTRLHTVYPVNGWVTESLKNGYGALRMQMMGVSERQIGRTCPLFGAGQTSEDKARFNMSPLSLVLAQILWNATQVVHLFLLVGLIAEMATKDGGWSSSTKAIRVVVVFVTAMSVAMLPLSVYFVSPGGAIYSVLVLMCSLWTAWSSSDFRVILTDNESVEFGVPSVFALRQGGVIRRFCTLELVAFLCNLGSSMYNYNGARRLWPYWDTMYRGIDSLMGWTGNEPGSYMNCFVQEIYTLGIAGVRAPLFVPSAVGSTTGHLMFLFVWSWLPFLYTVYFGLMYAMSHKAPGSMLQKMLCAWSILHFLTLTDVVDYKYGRGNVTSPRLAELCHWSERFAWRVALLLPVYQNVCSSKWKKGGTTFGIMVHYFMAAWGIFFFVYQVIMNDFVKFPQWLAGKDTVMMFGWKYFSPVGYYGALVLMWLFYAVSLTGCLPFRHVLIHRSVNASSSVSSEATEGFPTENTII